MNRLIFHALVGGLLLAGLAAKAQAPTVDPTGVWKMTLSSINQPENRVSYTLRLKLEGTKLTGTIRTVFLVGSKTRIYEWPIKEGVVEGTNISFSVTHHSDAGRGQVTSTYQGVMSGDTMSGTDEESFLDRNSERNWSARRER